MCENLERITFGAGVKSIGDWAFYNCDNLSEITIAASVTSIGEFTFAGCSSLTEITIPNSVTRIGRYAFEGCSSLKIVTFGENSQITNLSGAFAFCYSLENKLTKDGVTDFFNPSIICLVVITISSTDKKGEI